MIKRIFELTVEGIYLDNFVPSEAYSYSVLDYNFTWLELLYYYFSLTNDKDFITSKIHIIKRIIQYINKFINNNGY